MANEFLKISDRNSNWKKHMASVEKLKNMVFPYMWMLALEVFLWLLLINVAVTYNLLISGKAFKNFLSTLKITICLNKYVPTIGVSPSLV